MSLFSKNKNTELFSMIENDADDINSHFAEKNDLRADALTPDEVINFSANEKTVAAETGALEALKKRMQESKASAVPESFEKPEKTDGIPETDLPQPEEFIKKVSEETPKGFESAKHEQQAKASVPIWDEPPETVPITSVNSPVQKEPENHKKTLLERCKAYTIDEDGKAAVPIVPTYKLESVAEILSSESQKTIEKLSEHYDISFDDLGKYSKKEPVTAPESVSATPEREVFEDTIPSVKKSDDKTSEPVHIISDIDTVAAATSDPVTLPESSATIKFTPVSDMENSPRISVSSQTRAIDLTGELAEFTVEKTEEAESEIKLEQTEFEEYTPDEEYEYGKDPKHLLRKLSLKKRNSFFTAAASVFFAALLGFMRLPFMSGAILANTRLCMIICTAVTGIIVLLNIKMFCSLPTAFSRSAKPDANAAIASLGVLAYSVFGILKQENILDILILLGVILSVRALCVFFRASGILSNFRIIAVPTQKRAVKLIGDQAVTFAMAKDSIEGDVLAAAEQKTDFVDDYMKYSTFGIFLGGRMPVITVLSLVLAVITGFACSSYYDGIIYGFYSAAAVLCFAAAPSLFFIDVLPLYHAAGKLNRIGAMIAGKSGAERIEQTNAAVVGCNELFPSGTVTLHHMTILSDNNVDDTIIRAASLTDCLDSPLSAIFKKIAVNSNIVALPDSDTVKYEDRMGISGWVDNKLLFVGNRTLMEAHGIKVPDIETDRKILRQGFFPVYVAAEDRACALLVVQYSVRPETAREFRRLSSIGMTLLVNSSDPNLTEDMICDYLGLYRDSVKVMSVAGCHMYKNAATPEKHVSAPAAFRGNPTGLSAIINSAVKIKKANLLLSVLYALAAIIGTVMFAYLSFDGTGSLISGTAVLLYGLISTAVSLILYLTEKP